MPVIALSLLLLSTPDPEPAQTPQQTVTYGPVQPGALQIYIAGGFVPAFAFAPANPGFGFGGDAGVSFGIGRYFRLGAELSASWWQFDAPLIDDPGVNGKPDDVHLSMVMLGLSVMPHLQVPLPRFTLDISLGFKLGLAPSAVAMAKGTAMPYSLAGNRVSIVYPIIVGRIMALIPATPSLQFGLGLGFEGCLTPVVDGNSFDQIRAAAIHFDFVVMFGSPSTREKTVTEASGDQGDNSTTHPPDSDTNSGEHGDNSDTNTATHTDTSSEHVDVPVPTPQEIAFAALSDEAKSVEIRVPEGTPEAGQSQVADIPGPIEHAVKPLTDRICHEMESYPDGAVVTIVVSFQSLDSLMAVSQLPDSPITQTSQLLAGCGPVAQNRITIRESEPGLDGAQPYPLRIIAIQNPPTPPSAP